MRKLVRTFVAEHYKSGKSYTVHVTRRFWQVPFLRTLLIAVPFSEEMRADGMIVLPEVAGEYLLFSPHGISRVLTPTRPEVTPRPLSGADSPDMTTERSAEAADHPGILHSGIEEPSEMLWRATYDRRDMDGSDPIRSENEPIRNGNDPIWCRAMITQFGFLDIRPPRKCISIYFPNWRLLPSGLLDRVRAAKPGDDVMFTAGEILQLEEICGGAAWQDSAGEWHLPDDPEFPRKPLAEGLYPPGIEAEPGIMLRVGRRLLVLLTSGRYKPRGPCIGRCRSCTVKLYGVEPEVCPQCGRDPRKPSVSKRPLV